MLNPAFKNELTENGNIPNGHSKGKSKQSESDFTAIDNMDSINTSSSTAQLAGMDSPTPPKKERSYMILLQIVVPFMVAGFGMVGAGILFDEVQDWDLYVNISEIIVLVPALLGLKGNLEMTLASRLSTQVNMKKIYNKKTTKSAVLGNIYLTQLQSIVVGFLASFVACLTQFILKHKFYPANLLILIGSSVGTASFASLILGCVIMFIILVSERFKINPDNIATPIASSMGDLVTLGILSGFGTLLYIARDLIWIHIILIAIFLILIPILVVLTFRNEFVKEVLYQGWAPVIVAMLISSVAGVILEFAIHDFPGIAIYQPVVNGVGGNIVAIYASRLSTALHQTSELGRWADWAPTKWYLYPKDTFFSTQNREYKTSLILMSLILPGHTIFFFVIYFLNTSHSRPDLTAQLVLFYLGFTFFQVTILMLLCYAIIHVIWRLRQNPDNICIPLLTATGDLLGVAFLFLCFYLTFLTGDPSVRPEKETTSILLSNFTTLQESNFTTLQESNFTTLQEF